MPAGAASHQQVSVIDHYRNVEAVQLFSHARRWLGPITDMEVVLLEDKDVFPVSSHRNGMSGFIHHVPAIAALICDLFSIVVPERRFSPKPTGDR